MPATMNSGRTAVDDLLALEEIRNLRLAYCAHLDSKNPDALAALFAQDAVCEFPAALGGEWIGVAAIRQHHAHFMQILGAPYCAVHVVTNPWIELTGETTATGRWYLFDILATQIAGSGVETRGGHDNPLLAVGLYEDSYSKIDGRWRIQRARFASLWPERDVSTIAGV